MDARPAHGSTPLATPRVGRRNSRILLASFRGIGLSSPAHNAVRTAAGTILRLDVEAPKAVARYLLDDYQINTAAASTLATELTTTPMAELGATVGRAHAPRRDHSKQEIHNGRVVPWFELARSGSSLGGPRSSTPMLRCHWQAFQKAAGGPRQNSTPLDLLQTLFAGHVPCCQAPRRIDCFSARPERTT